MSSREDHISVKSRLNLKLDRELKSWIMEYADKQGTTVSTLIRDFFVRLRKEHDDEAEGVRQI